MLKLNANYESHFDGLYSKLSFTDFIGLMKFITSLSKKLVNNRKRKNQQTLNWLRSSRFGSVKKQHVNNLSSYKLLEKEDLTLSFGLNFCYLIIIMADVNQK